MRRWTGGTVARGEATARLSGRALQQRHRNAALMANRFRQIHNNNSNPPSAAATASTAMAAAHANGTAASAAVAGTISNAAAHVDGVSREGGVGAGRNAANVWGKKHPPGRRAVSAPAHKHHHTNDKETISLEPCNKAAEEPSVSVGKSLEALLAQSLLSPITLLPPLLRNTEGVGRVEEEATDPNAGTEVASNGSLRETTLPALPPLPSLNGPSLDGATFIAPPHRRHHIGPRFSVRSHGGSPLPAPQHSRGRVVGDASAASLARRSVVAGAKQRTSVAKCSGATGRVGRASAGRSTCRVRMAEVADDDKASGEEGSEGGASLFFSPLRWGTAPLPAAPPPPNPKGDATARDNSVRDERQPLAPIPINANASERRVNAFEGGSASRLPSQGKAAASHPTPYSAKKVPLATRPCPWRAAQPCSNADTAEKQRQGGIAGLALQPHPYPPPPPAAGRQSSAASKAGRPTTAKRSAAANGKCSSRNTNSGTSAFGSKEAAPPPPPSSKSFHHRPVSQLFTSGHLSARTATGAQQLRRRGEGSSRSERTTAAEASATAENERASVRLREQQQQQTRLALAESQIGVGVRISEAVRLAADNVQHSQKHDADAGGQPAPSSFFSPANHYGPHSPSEGSEGAEAFVNGHFQASEGPTCDPLSESCAQIKTADGGSNHGGGDCWWGGYGGSSPQTAAVWGPHLPPHVPPPPLPYGVSVNGGLPSDPFQVFSAPATHPYPYLSTYPFHSPPRDVMGYTQQHWGPQNGCAAAPFHHQPYQQQQKLAGGHNFFGHPSPSDHGAFAFPIHPHPLPEAHTHSPRSPFAFATAAVPHSGHQHMPYVPQMYMQAVEPQDMHSSFSQSYVAPLATVTQPPLSATQQQGLRWGSGGAFPHPPQPLSAVEERGAAVGMNSYAAFPPPGGKGQHDVAPQAPLCSLGGIGLSPFHLRPSTATSSGLHTAGHASPSAYDNDPEQVISLLGHFAAAS